MNPRSGYRTVITVVRKRPAEKGFVPKSGHKTETTVVATGGAGRGQVERVQVTYR